jgi:DNA helicase-2/ATP-dependent DNA helicase PcrA
MTNEVFETRYNQLNAEQKEAVKAIYGPVLVIAGPGSGKTELLGLRVVNILDKTDTPANSILCLTFTESAASNMRSRLVNLKCPEAHKVAIHTFHSFGTEVIAQNPSYFFFGAGFKPSDELAQFQILQEIFSQLDPRNPMSSFHPELGFTFLKDALSCIEAIKKGGLTPDEFREVLIRNKLFLAQIESDLEAIFESTVSAKTVENLWEFVEKIKNLKVTTTSKELNNKENEPILPWSDTFPTLQEIVLLQLEQVFRAVENSEKTNPQTGKKDTKPVTEWKKAFTDKDVEGVRHSKDFLKMDKMLVLADIYKSYQEKMFSSGSFDFADMLLEVVKVINDPKSIDLKYNLQEKYQYILVDEFQDTNGVQMRLLESLIDSDLLDFEPNILLVGDDDQAVFKFQGANIENMLKFKEKYPTTKQVVLTKNYRSTQDILDLAMKIAAQSSERITLDDGNTKKLEAVKK